MTSQPQLDLRDPRYKRPTMTVDTAKGILDCSEDEIIELIEVQGALVAWNIASPNADRRELRILTQSVADYLAAGRSPCYHSMLAPDAAVSDLVPDRPFLRGTDIQRILNCGSTHVLNLVESKALALVPGTNYQRGPGGTPSITVDSFRHFLTSRFVC